MAEKAETLNSPGIKRQILGKFSSPKSEKIEIKIFKKVKIFNKKKHQIFMTVEESTDIVR